MTIHQTTPSRSRVVTQAAEDGPQELSGVLMLVAFLLVLSALGLVVT